MILFAALGLILLATVLAGTNGIVNVNPEQATKVGVSVLSDDSAAGGQYIEYKQKVVNPGGSNSIQTVIDDVWGSPGNQRNGAGGVGAPWALNDDPIEIEHGYDFYHGARPGAWNNISGHNWVQPWCEIVRGESGVGESNWRVQIRGWKYFEYISGTWEEVYAMGDSRWGGTYNTKTINPAVGNLPFRSDGEGKWSSPWKNGPALMHPWSEAGRFQSRQGSARFATAEMRLIPNSNAGVDLSKVRAYGLCTWDVYPSATHSDNTATAGLIPKHKRMTPEWQHFNSITVPVNNPGNNPGFSYNDASQAIKDINPPINQ